MSSALALAGVTQLLRDLLNDGFVDRDVASIVNTNVPVHALPPDQMLAQEDNTAPALNVFLYHTETNAAWANQCAPTRNTDGDRVNNTPLPLDLYYLVCAHGTADLHSDVLLGYAMQILHEHPGFTRTEIQTALTPSPAIAAGLPPLLQALSDTGLADQAEALRIAPHYMPISEKTGLWSALQTQYRPSMAYRVSTVLLEAEYGTLNPLPVLTIGTDNSGPEVFPQLIPSLPQLLRVIPPALQASARLGDTLDLEGRFLEGGNPRFTFTHITQDLEQTVSVDAGGSALGHAVTLPNAPVNWAAGHYAMWYSAEINGDTRQSNQVTMQVAPVMTLPPTSVVRNGQTVIVTLNVTPNVHAGQQASLWLGSEGAQAEAVTVTTNTLVFVFGPLPAGTYPVRLRIDGADSWFIEKDRPPIAPDFTPRAPIYDPTQTVVVPA
ncbi:DUF4255 domain-containing protein [Enterovibrio calviensis]|uniref:DUF4255 domain-containing protein n=1 Tax=Enterovibrio calviensis TaxID=91359 RepID=UPI000487A9A0|nr:DUF4255 domain-containing protein [Enterovibrio calviensis]